MINPGGWPAFVEFWSAALSPELDAEFVAHVGRAALTTTAYAVLGTTLAVAIGLLMAPVMTRFMTLDGPAEGRARANVLSGGARLTSILLRGLHEVVWALILVQVLGLDPLVAIIAIGLPYGAVTARVFADHFDAVDPAPFRSLRQAGAGRLTAVLAAIVPSVRGDLVSYVFYRFECAMRSAAVLGIVGLGGLGFELSLSFQSLQFNQVWTVIWVLVILGGLADLTSSRARRDIPTEGAAHQGGSSPWRWSLLLAVPLAWWWVSPDVTLLWSNRSWNLARDLVGRAWPPALDQGGWVGLLESSLDTLAVATGAILLAATGSMVVSFVASASRWWSLPARFVLLVARAVPPPVWAFVVVLVLLPGLLPGAIALGFYNLGVLGRLEAEVVQNHDRQPATSLRLAGSTRLTSFITATLPAVSGQFRSLTIYRWEVAVRDSVMLSVAGVTGLGRDLWEQLAARDFSRGLTTVLALLAVTFLADFVAARLKRSDQPVANVAL